LEGTFGAGRNAGTTAVAFLFIYVNDLSQCHFTSPHSIQFDQLLLFRHLQSLPVGLLGFAAAQESELQKGTILPQSSVHFSPAQDRASRVRRCCEMAGSVDCSVSVQTSLFLLKCCT
jgi:hypothetical protein